MSSPGIPLTGLTRALLCALCLSGGASACDAADDSFRLSAGFADLPSYFPAYLGNGYLARYRGHACLCDWTDGLQER
jgi:hypothetical protein